MRAGAREPLGDGKAQAAIGARDERDFSGKIEHRLSHRDPLP